MTDIGLRQVADGLTAARHLGVPVAYYPKFAHTAFVRMHEAWLCHATPDGDRWLITATAGSGLYRPDDVEGSAILGHAILGAYGAVSLQPSADPFGPPAPVWAPQGVRAATLTGGAHIVYAVLAGDRVVVTAVPLAAAPPSEFGWCPPAG